jgi:hypothetical protein
VGVETGEAETAEVARVEVVTASEG